MKLIYLLIITFFISCQNKITSETVVGIQSYKKFPKSQADTLAKVIQEFYQVKTIVLPEIELPKSAFIQVKSARFRADSIIRIQNRKRLDTIDYILGVTQSDISTTKKDQAGNIKAPKYKYEDWGIMGLAYCPGKSCIVSSFRIQHKNQDIYMTRLKKITVHELGHNFGLSHCPNKKCVMTDAVESITTIDNAALALCQICKNKIESN